MVKCSIPVAHTEGGRCHMLAEHLKSVSDLASEFAGEFGFAGWAGLAGLWHDLGKFSEEFQSYIRSSTSSDRRSGAGHGRVDHSTCGAATAIGRFDVPGRLLAYVIAGHHAGLPDWESADAGMAGLNQRLHRELPVVHPPAEIVRQQLPPDRPVPGADPSMLIRMLFSCLVDADFLDTEAFMTPDAARLRGDCPGLETLLPKFDAYMRRKLAGAADTAVNRVRAEVLVQCIRRAEEAPGMFSLTVPTGGGKTLSSMAFALNHACRYKKRRIIYVIPYTSIIEQTADQFREILGNAVLEHHSNIEVPDTESEAFRKSKLASENWDAPIVVTTTVQFFESLYACRTSRCRKLHNIVNSVVILDEVQLLPPEMLNPILKALRELSHSYGVTLVLSTATQPAFRPMRTLDFTFDGLHGVKEIVADPGSLATRLRRVAVQVPDDLNRSTTWPELAQELSGHPTVLCVVSRRDDCRKLHRLMPKGTIHLSALMCGAHRSRVIDGLKRRLASREPTRVISTQLVEAGVDLDFPVVYRALAGLDSIAQAAGRCNREGSLDKGKVVVFVPEREAPPGVLRMAAGIGRRLLAEHCVDPLAPERFADYFRELYWLHGERLDAEGVLSDLAPDSELRFSFRTAAAKFGIIDESLYAPVFTRYDAGGELLGMLVRKGPERWLMRKLQRYVVNVPRYMLDKLKASGAIEEPYPGVFIQSSIGYYDDELGLILEGHGLNPDELVV